MERTYMRTYQRTGMRRRAHPRARYWQHDQPDEPMKFTKKLAIQSVVCIIIFALIWGADSLNNDISRWMKNEISYAINHNIDFQTAYRSFVDMTKYFASLLVKKDGESPTQPEPPQTEEASEQGGQEGQSEALIDEALEPTADPTAPPEPGQ